MHGICTYVMLGRRMKGIKTRRERKSREGKLDDKKGRFFFWFLDQNAIKAVHVDVHVKIF